MKKFKQEGTATTTATITIVFTDTPMRTGGPGGNRTPIYRMQTGCSTTKLQAQQIKYQITNSKMPKSNDKNQSPTSVSKKEHTVNSNDLPYHPHRCPVKMLNKPLIGGKMSR